jgi:hypothetical protein
MLDLLVPPQPWRAWPEMLGVEVGWEKEEPERMGIQSYTGRAG